MKRLAAIFVVAAAISGTAPMGASAAGIGDAGGVCGTTVWPLTVLMVPYC